MSNKTTILFLITSACIIAGSVWYQKHLSHKILYLESALLSEDKRYFEHVNWYEESVKDKIKMRSAYTDSFSFIFPLFDAFDTLNPCSNKSTEIDALVDRIAENTALRQIRKKEYSSTLEVFDEAFELILSAVDSMQLTQKPKEVPVLIVEEYSRSKDSCSVTMLPVFSLLIPDSVQVYKNDFLLDVDSLPFIYEGGADGFRFLTKNGQHYGKW